MTTEIETLGLTEERWAGSIPLTVARATRPDDVTSFFCVLQEEHAEEQTDGHWPKEVQHGPQEGESLVRLTLTSGISVLSKTRTCEYNRTSVTCVDLSPSGDPLPGRQFSPEKHKR